MRKEQGADRANRRLQGKHLSRDRKGPSPHLPSSSKAVLCAATFLFLSLPGCQSAMPSPNPDSSGTTKVVPNEFPLRFKKHNFESHCYNTIGCSVLYYRTYQTKKGEDEVSPAPVNAQYKKYWGGAMHIAIPNFPPPAVVKWKSMDGTAHEASIDIASIFNDELIRHNVPQDDLPVETAATVGGPDIFLEVNDRTVNVYTKATIYLKDTATRNGESREDLILAWSRTY